MNYGNYPDVTKIKKILVIKLRHLGDVLLTSCVFTTLKRYFPHAQIDAYVYKVAYPMLEGHSAIHHIYTYDRQWKKLSFGKRLQKEYRLLRKIRKENYDLVINLTEGDHGAIVSFMSKASIKVGLPAEGKGLYKKDKIYSHLMKNCSMPRHSVEKNLDALRKIGIFPNAADKQLEFYLSEEVKKKVTTLLQKRNFSQNHYLLLHPSSRWRFKCWPMDKWQELMRQLVDLGYPIVITGGEEEYERQMVENIIANIEENKILNLVGKISLKELGCLVSFSQAVICVDSLVLHLASVFKKPNFVFFGPTSEKNWGPWHNPHAHVIASSMSCRPCSMDGCGGSKISECLQQIDVETVIDIFIKNVSPACK